MTTPIHAGREGDDTRIDVRLVVAPIAGVFRPAPVGEITAEGELVSVGGVIGHIAGPGQDEAVTSFCAGFLVRLLHPVDRPSSRPSNAA